MTRSDGKSRDAEMRRNDTHRNPAGTEAQRFQHSEAAGTSSAEPRISKGGSEQPLGANLQRESSSGSPAEKSSLQPSRNNRPHEPRNEQPKQR